MVRDPSVAGALVGPQCAWPSSGRSVMMEPECFFSMARVGSDLVGVSPGSFWAQPAQWVCSGSPCSCEALSIETTLQC